MNLDINFLSSDRPISIQLCNMFLLTYLFSFFKSPDMEFNLDPYESVFDPLITVKSRLLLLLLCQWASMSTDPDDIISRFKVAKISYMKLPFQPEHEYLLIDVFDETLLITKQFILDRTGSRGTEDEPAELVELDPADTSSNDSEALKRLKKFVSTIATIFSTKSELQSESMEEGSSQAGDLSAADKVTLSLTETADLLSDSFGISEGFPAIDRFLGQHHVSKERWKGQVIHTVEPDNLTFFNFIILAHVAHELHPTYEYLKEQCYFYAGLVFWAVAAEWDPTGTRVSINRSGEGRYKGYKVKLVDREEISKLITNYHSVRPRVVSKVFYLNQSKTTSNYRIQLRSRKR